MNRDAVNILLVEDNDDHIELTKRALQDSGMDNEIYVVKDGIDALNFLYNRDRFSDKAKAPRPGLILLDIKLPKMDGFEVLKRVKSDPNLKSIPIIMLTTSSREEEILRGYSEGANSYVTKPVDFNEFVAKIRSLQTYWVFINSLPR